MECKQAEWIDEFIDCFIAKLWTKFLNFCMKILNGSMQTERKLWKICRICIGWWRWLSCHLLSPNEKSLEKSIGSNKPKERAQSEMVNGFKKKFTIFKINLNREIHLCFYPSIFKRPFGEKVFYKSEKEMWIVSLDSYNKMGKKIYLYWK